jgi:uncharacterized protein YbaA (DUF1428 family)
MAEYVDGFVLAVPRRKVQAYRRMAAQAGKVWIEHGALAFRECVADDVKKGKGLSFARSVDLKPGEVVFFSWIVFRSRAHRDRVNAKVMKDPRLEKSMAGQPPPFDMKRMLYGGFRPIVSLDARRR